MVTQPGPLSNHPAGPGQDDGSEAFAARAAELARWTMERLVNRRDVWGGYHPKADRGKVYTKPDGTRAELGTTTTRPARSKRGHIMLNEAVLARPYRGAAVEHVVGLHTTSPENTSRWGAAE